MKFVDEEFSKKVEILVGGEKTRGLRMVGYELSNTGQTPILPDDFVEPLTISVAPPWKIIAITRGIGPLTQSTGRDWEKKDDQHWILKPMLFNPGDSIEAIVYAILSEDSKVEDTPSWKGTFQYHGKIVGVSSMEEPPKLIALPNALETSVKLQAWSVYAFVGLWLMLFLLFLVLGNASRLIPRLGTGELLFVSIGALFSITSSEIIVSLFTTPSITQWPGSWVLLALHLMLVCLLLYRIFVVHRQRKGDGMARE